MIVSEDHIAILKALIHILPQEYYSASVEEALEIAVKLLENSNGLIDEELEKIKDEIGNEFVDLQDGSEEWRSYVNDAVLSCYEIIEKHITELKGESDARQIL